MWWECLPSAAIITVCLYVPQAFGYYFSGAVLGNNFRRELEQKYGRWMFIRDTRIDGAPWKVRGLENIPDEDK